MKTLPILTPRQCYLAGYVIEGTLCGSRELFHGTDFCAPWPDRPGYRPTVYKTKEAAEKVRARISSLNPTYVRPYVYETHNPEHAKGLPVYDPAIHGPLSSL